MTIQYDVRNNGSVEFEGATLYLDPNKTTGEFLEPGDTYVAERNSGPHLLTVKQNRDGVYQRWIEPVEDAYSFDWNECCGVLLEPVLEVLDA